MGLDNGIEIQKVNEASYESYKDFYYEYCGGGYEACYMRKWWGVRNMFVNYLTDKYRTDDINDGTWNLDDDDLNYLKQLYIYFDNEDTWDEEGDSIWYYNDDNIHEKLCYYQNTIDRLIQLRQQFPDVVYRFYDSY